MSYNHEEIDSNVGEGVIVPAGSPAETATTTVSDGDGVSGGVGDAGSAALLPDRLSDGDDDGSLAADARARLLKENLVNRYRRNKRKADTEDVPEDPKKTKGDYISTGIDHLTKLGSAAVEAESMVKDYTVWQGGEMDKKVDKDFAIGSMVNSGVAMLNNIFRLNKRTGQMAKMKNQNKQKAANRSIWGGIGGIATSLLGITTTGLKSLGDPKENKDQQMWGRIFGASTAVADIGSSFMSMLGGIGMNKEYNRIVKDSGAWNRELRSTDPAQERTLSSNAKRASGAAKRDLIQQRTDLKAKKYGMEMAQTFNKIKGDQITKGGFGFARSLATGANLLLKAFASESFTKSKGGGFLSLALNATSALLKYSGMAAEYKSDKNAAEKTQNAKMHYINQYLITKMGNLNVSTADIFQGVAPDRRGDFGSATLTDNEKERIIVARLGLDIPIVDQTLGDKDKMEAFKLLALKRAANIKNASDATRIQMLGALGLDDSASVEDIAKAITGE